MNFVYITTNLINGKQYVGSHDGDENDSYLGSGKIIKYSIKKYGKEKFKRKIIKYCKINDNLKLEEKYILRYNTLIPNGYNISPTGGVHKNGGKLSEETKRKISQTKKGTAPWNKGKEFSEESKEKMSKSHLGKLKSKETKKKMSDFQKGRIKSEAEKENISKSKKGKNNPMYGKIPWNRGLKLKNRKNESF
jgi:group I intron endonuclease